MHDWNNVHYVYLNEFKTIEFDLYIEPDSNGLENLSFLLDDAGYNADRTLVSFIAGWDPAHPETSYGGWIPVTIDLSQIGATIPRFMRSCSGTPPGRRGRTSTWRTCASGGWRTRRLPSSRCSR